MAGVRLPKAVQAQGEAADRALAELTNPAPVTDGPSVNSGDFTQDTDLDQQGQASNQAAEQATPEAGENDQGFDWKAEAEAVREQRDKAVHALQTLQGKYRAEVPRLHDEIRELKRERDDLKNTAPTHSESNVQFSGDLAQKMTSLKEAYGDDIEDVIRIAVDQAVGQSGKAVDSMRQEFEPRLSRVDQFESSNARNAQDAMFDAVAKKHADWENINGLATFHKFLAETLPGSTMTRQEAIDAAVNANDPEPIIYQLSQFKRRTNHGNSRMESQTVPGDTGRTEGAPRRDEKLYSLAAIQQFSVDMARLKSRGVPLTDDQKRLDATYEMALREGRVT